MDRHVIEDQRWVDVRGVNDAALMPADSYFAHHPAINDHTFTRVFWEYLGTPTYTMTTCNPPLVFWGDDAGVFVHHQ